MRTRRAAALLFGLTLLASPATAQEPRLLAIDDLFAIARVSDPQVSPDGWLAYTVTTTSLADESSSTRIWSVPLEGGEPLPMTLEEGSAASPRWSPDGRWLAFLASRGEDAETQVWLLDRRGGEAQQLTEVEQGVGGFAWSPDGKRLILSIRDPSVADTAETKPKTRPPHVIDRLQFKRDYAGYLDRRRTHLYLFELDGRTLRQLTFGDYDDGSPAWSPGGRRVAFVSNRTPDPDANANTDIWVVDVEDDADRPTLRQITTNPGPDGSPAWSPDGATIAHTTSVEPELIWYATTHPAVIDADGGEARLLTATLDRNVRGPQYTPDGDILVVLEDRGSDHLARFDPRTGALDRPVAGALSVSGFDVGADGDVAVLLSNATSPREVYALDAGGTAAPGPDADLRSGSSGLRPLTHVNGALLDSLRLVTPRMITFPSTGGTEVDGFLFTPPGWNGQGRLPLLLRIHGGPVAQYDWAFSFDAQLFAAHGYAVLMTNPRGSSGRGQAYAAALWADWGGPDYDDVMAGVDHAIALGIADPDRLGVGGWSYGGILTDHVITKTDRFEAAISGASEVLYVANYGHDHYQLQWEKELGLPWVPENRAVWERLSPFNRVERITTPTLLMGGEVDWNVPIQNSEQLYQALRRLGVPTRLVVYPGQHHGIRTPSYRKDRLQRYLDWYGYYLNGEEETRAHWGGPLPR